jgi:hypothetical protein
MLRLSILFAFLFGFLQGIAQPQLCDIRKDSVLNLWYRNYQMNFVRGEKWKAASLGMQILRYCPEWKPELYRETGLLYQDILDTAKNVGLRILLKDTLYSIYHKAIQHTRDSAGWSLVRAAAALRYEDQSDSILGLMLEPAIRLAPMRCPVQIIEDYFRIQDWQTRRGKSDTATLENLYQKLNVILARQFVFKDSLKEKDQIQKVKNSMAWRMARYLPDTATIISEAKDLKSDHYSDWLRIYARLFARSIEQVELLNTVRAQLIRTGKESIWEARTLLQNQDTQGEDWVRLAELEKDPWMKAWYFRQAGNTFMTAEKNLLAWQNLIASENAAPDWGASIVALARFALHLRIQCPNDEVTLKSLACTYYRQAEKKDIRLRRIAEREIPGFNETTCVAWPLNSKVVLKCSMPFEFTLP